LANSERVRHRCDLEIVASILSAVTDGPKRKTKIKKTANMNYYSSEKYLTRLLRSGLLLKKRNSDAYELTDRGKAFLDQYAGFKRLDELVVQG
jgi:predicted transcriptional regulator